MVNKQSIPGSIGSFSRFARHPLPGAAGPAGDAPLLVALDCMAVGLDIAGDYRAVTDGRPRPDDDARHERGVRPDERAFPELRPVLAEAVIIAGDRAGADICAGADRRIADVGQVIDLRPLGNIGILDLDEIADLRAFGEAGAGPHPGEGADDLSRADLRSVDMAEGTDRSAVGDLYSRPENHVRLDRHIAPQFRVVCKPNAFGIDQGRPLFERLLA